VLSPEGGDLTIWTFVGGNVEAGTVGSDMLISGHDGRGKGAEKTGEREKGSLRRGNMKTIWGADIADVGKTNPLGCVGCGIVIKWARGARRMENGFHSKLWTL
jgi:hypothetical protein